MIPHLQLRMSAALFTNLLHLLQTIFLSVQSFSVVKNSSNFKSIFTKLDYNFIVKCSFQGIILRSSSKPRIRSIVPDWNIFNLQTTNIFSFSSFNHFFIIFLSFATLIFSPTHTKNDKVHTTCQFNFFFCFSLSSVSKYFFSLVLILHGALKTGTYPSNNLCSTCSGYWNAVLFINLYILRHNSLGSVRRTDVFWRFATWLEGWNSNLWDRVSVWFKYCTLVFITIETHSYTCGCKNGIGTHCIFDSLSTAYNYIVCVTMVQVTSEIQGQDHPVVIIGARLHTHTENHNPLSLHWPEYSWTILSFSKTPLLLYCQILNMFTNPPAIQILE